MDKKELIANRIMCSVQEKLGDEYEVKLHYVTKTNKTQAQTELIIKKGETNISPAIYIDEEIQKYLLNLCSLETITDEIIKEYLQCDSIGDYDLSPFKDFGWVKGRLVCQLVNTSLNENLLRDIPSIPFMDLSIVFRVLLDPLPIDGRPSILVTNTHMKLWKTDKETIYAIAKENTPKLLPVMITELDKLIKQMLQERNVSTEVIDSMGFPKVRMYVLTNQDIWFGSYCINYDGILSSLAEKENANLYILPSSLHEVIVVPDSNGANTEQLKEMVSQVNTTSLPEEELLSYSVYYFSRETQKITQL